MTGLQICHEGSVKIDETEITHTLHIEGALEVQLGYLTDDDSQPIQSVTGSFLSTRRRRRKASPRTAFTS